MPEDDRISGGYVSWKRQGRWSTRHYVVGADAVDVSALGGYFTLCGRVVPSDADDYMEGPALSRHVDRIAPHLVNTLQGLSGGNYLTCRQCLARLEES